MLDMDAASPSLAVTPSRRPWLSAMELKVLALFAAGAALGVAALGLPALFFVSTWGAGLFFEYATKHLWTYAPEVQRSPFTLRGVNWLLGLGWVGAVTCGLSFAAWLQVQLGLPRLAACVVGVGLVGNAAEQLYFALGLFRYNVEQPLLAFPFKRTRVLWHIPASVRLGYFTSIATAAWALSAPFVR